MNTPSGAVCPNGHGKIRPGVTAAMLRKAERAKERIEWIASLPIVKKVNPGVYRIKGRRKLLRKVPVEILASGSRRMAPKMGECSGEGRLFATL